MKKSKNEYLKLFYEKIERYILAIILYLFIPLPHIPLHLLGGSSMEYLFGYYSIIGWILLIFSPITLISAIVGIIFCLYISRRILKIINAQKYLKIIKFSILVIASFSFILLFIIYPNDVYKKGLKSFELLNNNQSTISNCMKIKVPLNVGGNFEINLRREVIISNRDECFLRIIKETNDTTLCKYTIAPDNMIPYDYRNLCPNNKTLLKCKKDFNKWEAECKNSCISSKDERQIFYSFSVKDEKSYCNCVDKNNISISTGWSQRYHSWEGDHNICGEIQRELIPLYE